MSSVVLTGDTSGSGTITVPAVAGTFTATIGSATGTHYPFTAGTAVASTSGTSIDFTSIPSWVKRITVLLNGVSTNGTSVYLIQLGDAGGIENTGYTAGTSYISTSSVSSTTYTTGFGLQTGAHAAAGSNQATIIITNFSGNTWNYTGSMNRSDSGAGGIGNGTKELSDTLTQVRITTVNGTDTFDAGSINILYE